MSFAMLWPVALVVLSNSVYQICAKSLPPDIHPLAALTVTYAVGALATIILYYVLNRGGNLLTEFRHLNWSSFVLGLCIVGLEVGFIYLYKAGWPVSTGQLVTSAVLTVVLIFVGLFLYKENISPSKWAGIVICMVGLFFINR